MNLITLGFYCFFVIHGFFSEILNDDPKNVGTLKDLQPGWSFIQRYIDVSDIEWSSWKYFIHTSLGYLIFQFLISEIIRKLSLPILKYWYIISSVTFIISNMGLRQMIIIIIQPLLYSFVIVLGGKKQSIWIISIILLASYNSLKYKLFFWNFLDHEEILQDEEVYLILFSVAWIELRCISYSIDYVEKKEKYKNQHILFWNDIVNMLSYVLYLPLLYNGPVILYEEFERSFKAKNEKFALRIKKFIYDLFIFKLYSFILDIAFHYIYFFAMQDNMEVRYLF